MEQVFFELRDGRVIMGIAYNSVHAARDVPAADVANDDSIGCGSKPPRIFLKPIVILDGGLDSTIGRYFYPHLRQKFSGVLQLGEEIFGATLPEVYVKGLIPDDLRTS